MYATKIGYLSPLNNDFKQDFTLKPTTLSRPKCDRRNNVLVSDNRLSRKHFTLTAAADGSANLLVVISHVFLYFT